MLSLFVPLALVFCGFLALRIALGRARRTAAQRQQRMESYRNSPDSHILKLD
jgi:hypothetical protein